MVSFTPEQCNEMVTSKMGENLNV